MKLADTIYFKIEMRVFVFAGHVSVRDREEPVTKAMRCPGDGLGYNQTSTSMRAARGSRRYQNVLESLQNNLN